jgi:hypothetical protein
MRSSETQPILYVSLQGSDANRCSRRAPCRSLNHAYNLARPGQVVEVAAGRYPGEDLRDNSGSKTAPKVVIRPAPGARVSFRSNLRILGARQLLLRDLTIEPFPGRSLYIACASNLTLENVGGGRSFHISKGMQVLMRGGSWGGYATGETPDSLIGGGGSNCRPEQADGPSHKVTLDGVRIHDVYMGLAPSQFNGAHPDCLQLDWVDGLTIRNSEFLRCAQVFIGYYGDGRLTNVLIENNVFAKIGTDSYYGTVLDGGSACAHITFRYNTHDDSGGHNSLSAERYGFPRINCPGSRVVGNIFHTSPHSDSCGLNAARWTNNVYERAGSLRSAFVCGQKALLARRGNAGFVGRARNDYRLRSDSLALDRGTSSEFPRFDLRGKRRYAGRAPDAGAYERVQRG